MAFRKMTLLAFGLSAVPHCLGSFSVLSWDFEGCNDDGNGPRYSIAPMPEAECVWFPLSQACFSFFDSINEFPEFYAVGPASGQRGRPANWQGELGCAFHSQAGFSTNPNEVYQDQGVCNQRANEAGVTFSGCLNYAHDTGTCGGWVALMNCARDAFNKKACEDGDKTPKGYGPEGNGSVAPWVHTELRKRRITNTANETMNPAAGEYIFDIFSRAKAMDGNCLRTEYSDMLMTKNHTKAVQQYCNGTDHTTVFDRGTIITRFNDAECGGTRDT